MFKLEFSQPEIAEMKKKLYLTERQERILDYRMKEYSITKMADLEFVGESTISRELRKIKRKIMRII